MPTDAWPPIEQYPLLEVSSGGGTQGFIVQFDSVTAKCWGYGQFCRRVPGTSHVTITRPPSFEPKNAFFPKFLVRQEICPKQIWSCAA